MTDTDDTLSQLNHSASKNAIAAAEVSFSIDRLSATLEEQVQAISDIDQAAQELTSFAQQNAVHVEAAVKAAASSKQASVHGRASLLSAISDMQHINQQTGAAMSQIEALDERVQKIQAVTETIGGIARQTNLLALNAAIEAARAGEQGRGFAVVAAEVRKLASMTSESTQEVSAIVREILEETRRVVEQMKSLSGEVKRGSEEIESVGDQLSDINEQADRLERTIEELSINNHESLIQVQHVASGVSQLSGGLTESEHEMASISREARHLMELAEESNALIALKAHDSYHRPFFTLARESADAIAQTLNQAIDRGLVAFETLFDRDYQPIEGTNPQKYTTRWDALCDELLPPIQEPALASRPEVIFVHACDDQGYVPTHNKAFSQALTGDYLHDLKHNRTKRLFNDRTGTRAGENVEEMLLQTYKRDTGELVHDLSVPIYVKGEHWGALRVGYLPEP